MDDVPRPRALPSVVERIRENATFLGPGRVLTAALSILLVAAGCWWLLKAPAPPVEASLPYTAGSTDSTTADASGPDGSPPVSDPPATVPATIVAQAAGAVFTPGVYALPAGARVHELIAAAGGVTPDADPDVLSLAAVLTDGERVYVPRIGEVPPTPLPAAATGDPAGALAGPLDLNRASAAQLDELPGIGPATAGAIVDHRERNGPYLTVDDLLDVRGIGPAKLDSLRDLVTV